MERPPVNPRPQAVFAALFAPPHRLAKLAFAALCTLTLIHGAHFFARRIPAVLEDMRLQAMPAARVGLETAALPAPARLGPFVVMRRIALSAPDPRFGGVSGIAWQGGRLVGVSDRGFFLRFAPDLGSVTITPLRDTRGRAMRMGENDSEDVALMPDGRLAISFEGDHRVWLYQPDPFEDPKADPGPARAAQMRTLRGNGGMEALCATPEGALFAGEEGPFVGHGPHRIWRAGPGADAWSAAFGLTAKPGWGLTACAVLPGGELLTLHRFWRPGAPFQAEVGLVRAPLGQAERKPELLAALGARADIGNLEGIAQRKEPDGALTVWLVSDNNYGERLTELWELRLPAGAL